ncbi:MAG: S-methyl-5-thioribose kinase, partial [Verrucomicrobia bacterium]|nr:S-methyl-5-thioribose kinase [Verrucomicrobiota bacterium]
MAYEILTAESVVDYLKSIEAMQTLFSSFDSLEVVEVGDGNLNYVYLITNSDNPSETIALKQAVPYLRVVGESWALTRERMRFEIQALEKHKALCPDLVPDIYFSSVEMSVVIMQNLTQHKILRGQIIEGKVFPHLADHMSTFLANTLFFTSDWYLKSGEKKEAVAQFINPELCNLTEDFVFTHPYEQNETNDYNSELTEEDKNFIHQDGALKIAVAEMKYKFMNNAEALLHGDLHIGSLMTNEEETYVIDPEFAFYGPMGFDIGAFIGN